VHLDRKTAVGTRSKFLNFLSADRNGTTVFALEIYFSFSFSSKSQKRLQVLENGDPEFTMTFCGRTTETVRRRALRSVEFLQSFPSAYTFHSHDAHGQA